MLGGSVFLKKKELVGKVWVYETHIDNGYNKIKQPPNTSLHIAKCDMKLTQQYGICRDPGVFDKFFLNPFNQIHESQG